MQTDPIAILRALPQKIPTRDIPEFERLDERVARVNVLYANIIGCQGEENSAEKRVNLRRE